MPRRRYRRAYQDEESTAVASPAQAAPGLVTEASPALNLPQIVGNQAMQRMLLQRVGDAEADAPAVDAPAPAGPLSKLQVIQAISYYNMRSRDYTPQIISQIQAALGVTITGRADEEMVQAVASWQALEVTNGLKVDGMAGPRTLPYLFKQGLERDESMEVFADGVLELQDDWDALGGADARAQQLMDLVNEELIKAQVPECDFTVKDLPGLLGQFDFETWSVDIGKPAFDQNPIGDAEFNDAANTIYHEARHAEQWFSMARMLAGQGKKADQIAKMMGIPVEQANEAVGKKYDPKSTDALVANGWYQSVYGVDAQHRNNVFNELDAADKELEAAQKALQKSDTAANRQRVERARQRRERAYQAYRNLPEENDAHRVGDTLTILLELKKTLPDED